MANTAQSPAVAWLARTDRGAGRAVRGWARRRPALRRAAVGAARLLSPGVRCAVAVLVARPASRRLGVRALVAGAIAATIARGARDRLGRRRPGGRAEGGFPSRHAAAAAAIALAAHRAGGRRVASGLALAAAAGLAGRVVSGDHEPADVAAGVLLGLSVAVAVTPRTRPR